ncbi:MAG TPA: ShlB/FhaC/HecB family hemolysin secretion/activation protein [Burkholderiaceae bacterium]|nr:ShlB/FhaC/HecB family hemolysin secretion/activation protein [Burkholderiaceae bacterium]
MLRCSGGKTSTAGVCLALRCCVGPVLLLTLVVTAWPVAAQVPRGTQPGRIERDIKRPPEPRQRDPVTIDRPRFPEQLPEGATTTTFVLRAVMVSGATVFTPAELAPIWNDRIGQTITVAEAFGFADAISARYRDAGYILSQAYVPPQDLARTGATLRIDVIEGYVERISFTQPEYAVRLTPLLAPIVAERPLRLATLERYLLLINERAAVAARANLSPGTTRGATHLEIETLSLLTTVISLGLSNRSTEALGTWRVDAAIDWRDALDAFERHTLRLQSSLSNRLNYVSYNLDYPLGREGFRTGFLISASRSNPKTDPGFKLDTRSDALTLHASYALVRSRRLNVDPRLAFHVYNNASDIADLPLSRDRIRAVRLGALLDFTDGAGGVNLLDLEASRGLSGLGASRRDDPELSRAGADPQFTKVTLYAARVQYLLRSVQALLAVTAQSSNDRLVTAEQIGLGGETFLRAFDASEYLGDRGYAGKLELRFIDAVANFALTWYGFFDAGRVERREFDDSKTTTSLRSFGTGLRVSGPRGARGYLEIAKPGGRDPVSTGSDRVRFFGGLGIDF